MKKIIFLLICIVIYAWNCYVPQPNGIDVSHYNSISWAKVAENPNIEFVYVKATEGNHFIDNKFLENMEDANHSDIHVGAYHYFRTNVSGEKQFNNFSKALDQVEFDLIPAIDIEEKFNDFSNKKYIRKQLRIFIQLFEKKYGVKPIIYYGSMVASVVTPVTYDCKIWVRTMEYSNYIPNVSIKQVGYFDFSGKKVDANYCSNINKIMLK